MRIGVEIGLRVLRLFPDQLRNKIISIGIKLKADDLIYKRKSLRELLKIGDLKVSVKFLPNPRFSHFSFFLLRNFENEAKKDIAKIFKKKLSRYHRKISNINDKKILNEVLEIKKRNSIPLTFMQDRVSHLKNLNSKKQKPNTLQYGLLIIQIDPFSNKSFRERGIGKLGQQWVEEFLQTFPDVEIVGISESGSSEKLRISGRIISVIDPFELEIKIKLQTKNDTSVIFFNASPMTLNQIYCFSILSNVSIFKVCLFHDLIPLKHSNYYLKYKIDEANYLQNLLLLKFYDEVICNSYTTKNELSKVMATRNLQVALPSTLKENNLERSTSTAPTNGLRILLFAGDDIRKNLHLTLSFLNTWARRSKKEVHVSVIGVSGIIPLLNRQLRLLRLNNIAISLETYLLEDSFNDHVANSDVAIIPSLDEGLSIPVIECMNLGVPIVASRIDVHQEILLSQGNLYAPRSYLSFKRAIDSATKLSRPLRYRQSLDGYPSYTSSIRMMVREK